MSGGILYGTYPRVCKLALTNRKEEFLLGESEHDFIFALDIGTRSVIGIVGRQEHGLFHVVATDREEYQNRAVVDGQIENIAETAKVADIVKQRLEKKLTFPLKEVYIAAAGRVLQTIEMDAEEHFAHDTPITEAIILKLETTAIQKAHELLAAQSDADGSGFFCVGHSVMRYWLDEYQISSLLGHRGKSARLSLIVTFLPREVMESLYTTMTQIGLTVAGLTLEPIAAMNAIIPSDLRKLNLALCDIGAGTSDIALCDDGAVKAYTMATIAGDEVTEAIMRACLVDFQVAEHIKKQLSEPPETPVQYQNILGFSIETSVCDISSSIAPVIEKLAGTICQKILETNGGPPSAVFLVGGGSKTPGLQALISTALQIDLNRVAVGGNVYLKKMVSCEEDLFLPEYATPLGIALTAAALGRGSALSVMVNDRRIHLFHLWDTSVLSVLQMAGYHYWQIVGQAGKSVSYTIDGERRIAYGEPFIPAQITRGDTPVALSEKVEAGDILTFIPAQPGKNAAPLLSDLIKHETEFSVTFEGGSIAVLRPVQVNGAPPPNHYEVQVGDRITLCPPPTLLEFLDGQGVSVEGFSFLINGQWQGLDYLLQPGDSIVRAEETDDLSVRTEPEPEKAGGDIAVPDAPAEGDIIITLNGKSVTLETRPDGTGYHFFDLLRFVENADVHDVKEGIVQTLNGQSVSYLEPLKDGDQAEIFWK